MDPSSLVDFDSLPSVHAADGALMPQGCSWGLFDTPNKKDIYGTLNLLTPSVISSAYTEIRTGHTVSLNWSLQGLKTPAMRRPLVHRPINLLHSMGMHGSDDEVEFNTQCSSQWDSAMHCAHQGTGLGYNGVKTSVEELVQGFGEVDVDGRIPTLNHWHMRGGLVARGVFLDYKRWAERNGKDFDPLTAAVFSIANLESCAKDQGVEFKLGDVLIVRSGLVERFGELDLEPPHFAAVAGDMIAFEGFQVKEGEPPELVLHPYLLAMFGMPIGELWDLKAFSEHCSKTGKYSFLLTSVPLNASGLAGSPPNALALF